MSPLSDQEKEMIAQWAEGLTQHEDIPKRDFAFHLMANCEVSDERILEILERNRTFSQSALEHIQKTLKGNETTAQLDGYLLGVAAKLLTEERVPSRDRGRHMLITLARSEEDWEAISQRFSEAEVADLRQGVIERFLGECPDGGALTLFIENVVATCLNSIQSAKKEQVHQEASHMHWVLTCLERAGNEAGLSRASSLFMGKFGSELPYSVQSRLYAKFPPEPAPTEGSKKRQEPKETNAQVAERLGVSKRQVAKMRARGELL
ncbi:MAG: hypothetical protein WD200_03125 [Candidatus Andersenbacteria bacterium]